MAPPPTMEHTLLSLVASRTTKLALSFILFWEKIALYSLTTINMHSSPQTDNIKKGIIKSCPCRNTKLRVYRQQKRRWRQLQQDEESNRLK
jgi:hypothetical protein